MKTKFSIILYFDPYGDKKSDRKYYGRLNYESDKSLSEVEDIINIYNKDKYYNAVSVAKYDNRQKLTFDFDTSYYIN